MPSTNETSFFTTLSVVLCVLGLGLIVVVAFMVVEGVHVQWIALTSACALVCFAGAMGSMKDQAHAEMTSGREFSKVGTVVTVRVVETQRE